MSPNMRGAMLMTGSMTAFTLNDACMKALSQDVPMFQALFIRGVVTSLLLGLWAWKSGAFSFRLSSRDRWLIVLRTATEVAAAYFFISALFNMPLANVSAILQALPLTVSLASAMVFGEKIGWRRMGAITVGFVGVLLIVKPGADGFNIFSIYALIAVLAVTVRDLAARRLSKDVPSMTVALSAAVAVTVFAGLPTIGAEWVPVSARSGWLLAGAALFIIGGYLFSVMTMRVGDIGFVAPFRYSSLLAALVLGLLIFGDWPDNWTLIGSAIVVATGVFTIYRERRLARAIPPAPLRVR